MTDERARWLIQKAVQPHSSRRRLLGSAAAFGVATAVPSTVLGGRAGGNAVRSAPSALTARAQDTGGELRAAFPTAFLSLDPHGETALSAATAAGQFMDTLVIRDPVSGEIGPELAVEWETPDERTWAFTLREGVTFHDGTPFTAADVKASLERVQALDATLAPLWADVEQVETPDDTTVRITTTTPVGTLLRNATTLYIGPADQMNEEDFWEQPVGTGPFRVVSWRQDADLVLESNTNYWNGAPALQRLIFRHIPEEVARVTALETGEIHFTREVSPDQLPTLSEVPDLVIESAPSWTYELIWMNAQREPFTDVRVRQAMWHALDLDTIINDLLGSVAQRPEAPIPSTVFGFAPQTPYTYDPERARQLLSEAGFPDGFDASLSWNEGSAGPLGRSVIQTMISYWNEAGARIADGEMERGQWVEDLLALNWDMTFLTNTVLTGDADYTLRRLYVSSANRTGYANPELDALLIEAAQTVDQDRRAELYAQANRIIWDEAVGVFPADLLETYVYRTSVSGLSLSPDEIPRFHRVTVSE